MSIEHETQQKEEEKEEEEEEEEEEEGEEEEEEEEEEEDEEEEEEEDLPKTAQSMMSCICVSRLHIAGQIPTIIEKHFPTFLNNCKHIFIFIFH